VLSIQDSGLSAESNTQSYHSTSDPWVFTGDTPGVTGRISESLSRFKPLPEGYAGQFYQFQQALQHGTELPVTLEDARASLDLITAIYYSAQTNQSVDLPIGRNHPRYANWLP
jgi:predicted dehydrogenase